MLRITLLSLVLFCWASARSAAAESCEDLGFTSLCLRSDCKQLQSFVTDEELVADCLRCCADDSAKEEVTYTAATLEVCPHTLK